MEYLRAEDSGLHEVVAQTSKLSSQNATSRLCLHKSETNAETQKKKNKENGHIIESLITKSTQNSVITNGGHPSCANGF